MALALARAALELPNPPHRTFGVDPRRESIRWRVALAAMLYKAKIALTTFLIKVTLRGLLGRVMGRALFELVTIPVTAVWNAVVCFMVVREARLRTMGPSAAIELVGFALADWTPSPAGRAAAFRSVASAVVRTQDFHPNHLALLRVLVERLGPVDVDDVNDSLRVFSRKSARLPRRQAARACACSSLPRCSTASSPAPRSVCSTRRFARATARSSSHASRSSGARSRRGAASTSSSSGGSPTPTSAVRNLLLAALARFGVRLLLAAREALLQPTWLWTPHGVGARVTCTRWR